jgi:hypothetical protein
LFDHGDVEIESAEKEVNRIAETRLFPIASAVHLIEGRPRIIIVRCK